MKQKNYETVIASYCTHKTGFSKKFISKKLAKKLRNNLINFKNSEKLQAAGIGNSNNLTTDNSIRRDKIYWLDRKHNDAIENEFLDLIDDFILYLNRTCFTAIVGYEFHYALYEKGAFYKRHLDKFKDDDSRAFSMITYLNKNWKEEDGGNLQIYHADQNQTINPKNRSTVFFNSRELEHEVLLCNTPRMSITGWLKTI